MTQAQYQWLKDNGYDPTVYDVDSGGRVIKNPIAQEEPQREVMSAPRAFGTSFLGNLLPAGAGLGAGSLLAPLALSNPWTGIPAVIAGSLAAGYGTGKAQQAVLENYAPEALQEMQRAETDQPIASWAGGSAPALLTFKPSLKGIEGLSAPLMRGRDVFTKFDPATISRLTPAALNVGVNAANAGAGQLINMSEGGEFSLPRFAADTAFGSIVSNPNALGRRMGFPSLTPQRGPVERMDLAGENARRADIATMAEDVAASDRATELLGKEPSRSGPMFGPDARKFDIYENQKAVTEAFDKLGIEKNPETIQDFVNDPMLSNFRDDPAAVLDYVSEKTGLKSRRASESFESDYAGKPTEFTAKPIEPPIDPRRISVAENRKAVEEVLTKMKAAPPEEFMQDLANDPIIGNLRDDPQAFQDFIVQKAEKYLEKSWQTSMDDINRISKNLEEGFGKEEVAEFDRAQARREEAKNLGIKDIQPARDAAEEIHQRFQRPAEEGPARITQEDLDAASEIAAVRGLKLQFEDLGGGRGKFQLQTPEGVPIISIDPSAATRDTAIHEIGHDVFARSVGEGMKKGLLGSVEESPTYKAEYESRVNARDEQGNPTHTEQQARDIALEEGLIQAFGEQHPNVKSGAIRQWFNALKASMKDLAGMKLSPEDASAYLYYLTNENVPWKGVAVAKTGDVGGEERMQRGPELFGLTNEDFATSSDPKFLHATHLEQNNPTGLRVAVRESSGKVTVGKLGELHMDLPAVTENSEFGFVDKAGNFLTREQASAQRANPDIRYQRSHVDDAANIADRTIAEQERVADEFAARYQRPQQETPEFKNWFGDSKVVDADGKPLTVYHGTQKAGFDIFHEGSHFGTKEQVDALLYDKGRVRKQLMSRPGESGEFYRRNIESGQSREFGVDDSIYPVYLSIKNPKRVIDAGDTTGWMQEIKRAKAEGHDGLVYANNVEAVGDSYVAFNPEQIKSATGNRGTFDPMSKDIRYQRGFVGKAADAVKAGVDKTLAEIDQITRRGGIYETVGRSLTRAYNTEKSMLGKARSLALKIINLDYSDANKLRSHLYNEYRNQQLITPAPEIAEAYKEWRTQAKAFWVDEANKVGHQIDTGKKGLRNRIENEFWFPGHDLSDEVRDILAKKVGTPEYQKLKNDYLRDAEADYLSQGKVMAEAQEKALVDFEEQRALNNKTFDPSAPANFAGARKPMGRPLPESWVEKDFRKTLESYNKRSAKDYAAQEHFEKSPEVMAALGSKRFFNGQDIPANVLQNTPVIAPDPSIQSVMREFSGQPLQMPGKAIRSIGSAASAIALQTISRIGDVGGTVTKPLAYIGLGDYGAYMGGMAEKLSNWSKLKARSIESGLNNPNANQDFHQVIGMGEDAGKYMQKVLDSIGFITGSSKLESVARTLAQAQGEMIVSINKRKAATGDKDAVRFLDTLNNDWRTQSDMALAAQFGDMMQGTYDMRQLPAWFLEGGAAPYLTWSKWSMSQMNNFRKFAVEPAMQGNLKPLIAQVLVGMAGGGAIEQVQEWLSGKESKSVKWSELESWAKQNQGKIGTDGGELLLQKFMIMAQKTGTFGFAGDLAMMPINALVGDTQSSVGVFPAAELFADGMKNVAGALTAIDKGEDVGLVLQRFGKNVIVGKTQMARVASTWIDEVFNEGSENLRSSDRRKARLFEELSGTGRSNGMFPVSYENLAEQAFERGSITGKTGEEAFSLVSDARKNATSPEDYASRIRKLKTSQNAIMPSLERQPMKAARYLSFVEGAEPGKGGETLKRYMIRENEDKYRKSLIEGMSGIR